MSGETAELDRVAYLDVSVPYYRIKDHPDDHGMLNRKINCHLRRLHAFHHYSIAWFKRHVIEAPFDRVIFECVGADRTSFERRRIGKRSYKKQRIDQHHLLIQSTRSRDDIEALPALDEAYTSFHESLLSEAIEIAAPQHPILKDVLHRLGSDWREAGMTHRWLVGRKIALGRSEYDFIAHLRASGAFITMQPSPRRRLEDPCKGRVIWQTSEATAYQQIDRLQDICLEAEELRFKLFYKWHQITIS